MINRREFFRYLAAASAATATFAYGNPLRPRLRFAQAATGKTLVTSNHVIRNRKGRGRDQAEV
jgi:hypothetical protein